jgi:sugar phosphate isomerase/epimerase
VFNVALAPSTPAADVREQAERRGLTIAAVSGTYSMAHPDAGVRAAGRRWLGDLIATAPTRPRPGATCWAASRQR